MFKFSLGSFSAFPIFTDLVHVVSRKRLIVEWNGPKFGSQGWVFSVYRVLLTVKSSKSSLGSFSAFPIFMTLYLLTRKIFRDLCAAKLICSSLPLTPILAVVCRFRGLALPPTSWWNTSPHPTPPPGIHEFWLTSWLALMNPMSDYINGPRVALGE